MAYEIEEIRASQNIFYRLLCDGELSETEEPELYKAYVESEEVMNLVKNQGEIADCVVERFGSIIYLMPKIGNTVLGFSKAELKKELCKSGATDKDYYLSQFVILTLLAEFYDGQGSRCKSRDFMKSGELQNLISERLKAGIEAEAELEHTGLDYQSMSEAFEALKSDEARSRKKTTKEGFLNNLLDFLEKQSLIIHIQEDEMIKTTKKLDNIMEMKLLNKNNYEHIMQVLGVIRDEQNEPDSDY